MSGAPLNIPDCDGLGTGYELDMMTLEDIRATLTSLILTRMLLRLAARLCGVRMNNKHLAQCEKLLVPQID